MERRPKNSRFLRCGSHAELFYGVRKRRERSCQPPQHTHTPPPPLADPSPKRPTRSSVKGRRVWRGWFIVGESRNLSKVYTFFDLLLSLFKITIPDLILYCFFLTIDKIHLDGENNIFVYFLKSEKELNKE